jgi:hypothetical protein
MTKPSSQTRQPKDERDALNLHGVFLKKRVVEEIRRAANMHVFAEEFGVGFNEPVAIDVIGVDRQEDRQFFFVFECKRAYTEQKTWIFFRDISPVFRVFRRVSGTRQFGHYVDELPLSPKPPVCSEGYELVSKEKAIKADQNPIYDAGNQLCKGFLGLVQARMTQNHLEEPHKAKLDCLLAVLVTTAELRIAEFDVSRISLRTGNLEGDLSSTICDWLVLKHPFGIASGVLPEDFRDRPTNYPDMRYWSQVHRESLFVVNAAKLPTFLGGRFRDYIHDLEIR